MKTKRQCENNTFSLQELGRKGLAVLLTISMASMNAPFAYAVEEDVAPDVGVVTQSDQPVDQRADQPSGGESLQDVEGADGSDESITGEDVIAPDDKPEDAPDGTPEDVIEDAKADDGGNAADDAPATDPIEDITDESTDAKTNDTKASEPEATDEVERVEPIVDVVREESETATDNVDLTLALDHAYIHYMNQAIAYPVSSLALPASQDFQFAASADEGYEITEVKMISNGNDVRLSPSDTGIYTVRGDLVTKGSKLVVTAAGNAIEGAGVTLAIDEEVNTQTTFVYEDDEIKATATLTDPTVVPAGVELRVAPVTEESADYNYKAYQDALSDMVTKEGGDFKDAVLLYDVAFMDGDEEVVVDDCLVMLDVVFKKTQLRSVLEAINAYDVEVFHLPLSDQVRSDTESTAKATDISAADVITEPIKADVEIGGRRVDKASFVLDGLSIVAFVNTAGESIEMDADEPSGAAGGIDVEATLELNRSWKSGDVFEFELSATDESSRDKLPHAVRAKTEMVMSEEETRHVAIFNHAHVAGLNFTQEDVGNTYTFLLMQVNGGLPGITYDTSIYNVHIAVLSDNGDGTLQIERTYTDLSGNTIDEVVFSNSYEAKSVDVGIMATQSLVAITNTDRELQPGEFEFVLHDASGSELDRQTNGIFEDSDGTKTELDDPSKVKFENIEYKAVGDYIYSVSEIVPEDAEENKLDGVEYDGTTHYVQVHITDHKFDGQLDADYTYDNVEGNTTAPVFTNTFFSAEATVSFDTYYYGTDTERTFDFLMMPATENFRLITARTSAIQLTQGSFKDHVAEVVSEPIVYTEPGTYRYVIFEQGRNLRGVSPDDAWILVTVQVSKDAHTTVSYQMRSANGVRDLEDGERPVLYNNGLVAMSFRSRELKSMAQRASMTSFEPSVRSVLVNGILRGGEFEFAIFAGSEASGEPMQIVTNDANGRVVFNSIMFDSDDIGSSYTYTIYELPTSDSAFIYDSNKITLDLYVGQDDDGALQVESSYSAVDEYGEYSQTDDPAFINSYDTIVIHTVMRSREPNENGEYDGLPGAHYGLWMVNSGGEDVYMGLGRNQLEEAGSLQESDENGNLYYDMPLVEGAAYYFLEEWPPPAGHLVDPYPTDFFTLVHEGGTFKIVYETEPEFAEHCPGVSYELKAKKG